MPAAPPDWTARYERLVSGVGHVRLHRATITLGGADRQQFLNNFCTNKIADLKPGEGCEAFITSVQGKTIALALVRCCPDQLVVDLGGGSPQAVIEHLDRYVLSERVTFADRTAESAVFLIAGAGAAAALGLLTDRLPELPMAHCDLNLAGGNVNLCRVRWAAGYSFFLTCQQNVSAAVGEELEKLGIPAEPAVLGDALRIEGGTPLNGVDVTPDNLPQEVQRDEFAINFAKGCYLGQETVARIDAMGHVNWVLTGLASSEEHLLQAGQTLRQQERDVARVTSTCWSPALEQFLGLAYVRRNLAAPGSTLQFEQGQASVVALPVKS